MTDVVVPVFIPYARFLEVSARRLAIDTDITPPDEHPTNVAVSSAQITNDESSAGDVVRVLTTARSTVNSRSASRSSQGGRGAASLDPNHARPTTCRTICAVAVYLPQR